MILIQNTVFIIADSMKINYTQSDLLDSDFGKDFCIALYLFGVLSLLQ